MTNTFTYDQWRKAEDICNKALSPTSCKGEKSTKVRQDVNPNLYCDWDLPERKILDITGHFRFAPQKKGILVEFCDVMNIPGSRPAVFRPTRPTPRQIVPSIQ